MDIKLENLIDKLKKDAIDRSQKEALAIVEKASQDAKNIISEARVQADDIVKKAKLEAQKLKDNTESALKQGSRDLILSLRQELVNLFDKILKNQIAKDLDSKLIGELIVSVVNKWSPQEGISLEVLVGDKDKKKISEFVLGALKEQAKESIEIKAAKTIDKGFMIGLKGDDVTYDFSDESILEALKVFLNPTVAALLDNKK